MSLPKATPLDWLPASELARRWNVSVNTVYRKLLHERSTPDEPVPEGKLPAVRVGEQLRVHIDEVERFERRGRTVEPAAKPGRRALAGAVKDYLAD